MAKFVEFLRQGYLDEKVFINIENVVAIQACGKTSEIHTVCGGIFIVLENAEVIRHILSHITRTTTQPTQQLSVERNDA